MECLSCLGLLPNPALAYLSDGEDGLLRYLAVSVQESGKTKEASFSLAGTLLSGIWEFFSLLVPEESSHAEPGTVGLGMVISS